MGYLVARCSPFLGAVKNLGRLILFSSLSFQLLTNLGSIQPFGDFDSDSSWRIGLEVK